ncbi:hypothetical protein GNI_110640 [Gregarina niphandrodes]|uniref:Uncharacterized protein n=1 Tax=Gregarina niphandrodes TaxID=110365 RepID=A0A023B3M4_GRENI|nr:hypothetical protein GNI_110640 [Gregarina niphandrodes]EZG55608.1 hypothetical protein GNI_110640 [Gregarina niphandrodes]|eukprot:XP_011131485.1 hypothetical protein GNI_110640 [Gregarina niphandrodes]
MNTPSSAVDPTEDLYQRVAGLTCASLYSCCSLVESVVGDLVSRLTTFFEEAEVEFNERKALLLEAYECGDTVRMLELIETKSTAYNEAAERVIEGGRTAATRSLLRVQNVMRLETMAAELKAIDEAFLPPTSRQKRTSSIAFNSTTPSNDFKHDKIELQIRRLTELKMTPKLASAAASIFQTETRRTTEQRTVKELPPTEEEEEEDPTGWYPPQDSCCMPHQPPPHWDSNPRPAGSKLGLKLSYVTPSPLLFLQRPVVCHPDRGCPRP